MATTAAEREAVYRFRYTVYVEEMGRYHAAADHVNKRLVDPEDEHSWIFYATDGNAVIAANRCTWGAHGFSERQIAQYGLAPFLAELPPTQLFVGERTMVAAAYRGTSVASDLSNGVRFPIPDEDLCVVFGACEPHLLAFYADFGVLPYAERNINSCESGYLVPLVSFPRGIEALRDASAELPQCVQRVLDGHSAVTSAATVGDDGYRARIEDIACRFVNANGSLFDGLTLNEIHECTARSSIIECAPGDRVLTRGGTARSVFVVVDGWLDAYDGDQKVGQIRRGEVFGETAFLLHQPRTVDVVSGPSTTVLCLSERTLRHVMTANATLAQKLLLNVARTLCTRTTVGRRGRGSFNAGSAK